MATKHFRLYGPAHDVSIWQSLLLRCAGLASVRLDICAVRFSWTRHFTLRTMCILVPEIYL